MTLGIVAVLCGLAFAAVVVKDLFVLTVATGLDLSTSLASVVLAFFVFVIRKIISFTNRILKTSKYFENEVTDNNENLTEESKEAEDMFEFAETYDDSFCFEYDYIFSESLEEQNDSVLTDNEFLEEVDWVYFESAICGEEIGLDTNVDKKTSLELMEIYDNYFKQSLYLETLYSFTEPLEDVDDSILEDTDPEMKSDDIEEDYSESFSFEADFVFGETLEDQDEGILEDNEVLEEIDWSYFEALFCGESNEEDMLESLIEIYDRYNAQSLLLETYYSFSEALEDITEPF